MKDLIAKFWSKTTRSDGCWEWTGTKMKDSRGVMSVNGKNQTAPRISWYVHFGYWPEKGVFVCHSCDNPSCVNPKHLWLGDVKSNAQDAASKKRLFLQRNPEKSFFASEEGKLKRARNEDHGSAKLKNSDVLEIREIVATAKSKYGLYVALSKRFGVCKDTIQKIAKGKKWKSLTA